MKWCVLLVILCACAAAATAAERNADHKFTRTYPSTAGQVIFTHERHANTYARDCHFCHSGLKVFGGKMTELFAHNFCDNCHQQKSTLATQKCAGCHEMREQLSMK